MTRDGSFWDRYADLRARVESALSRHAPQRDELAAPVFDAIDHALASGKRIRPMLVCESAALVGGDPDAVLAAACAVELIHTASLILDDLPCMDDAAVRRGRPATHVAFGEADAVLAASAMLVHGTALIMENALTPGTRVPNARRLAAEVGASLGSRLVAGQAGDLALRRHPVDVSVLGRIYAYKTGELLAMSATLGARLCGASPQHIAALDAYARDLGLAKQIVDDILDCAATSDETGKDVGKDVGRPTYVTLHGLVGASRHADALFERAAGHLRPFGQRAWFLAEMIDYTRTVHAPPAAAVERATA